MTATGTTIPPTVSEAEFQATVIDAATRLGWRVHHTRPARTRSGWATPVTGHPGLPDLVLARAGVVLLAELKTGAGRLGPGQAEWLDAAGVHARLWRPADWPQIVAELQAGPR